MMKKTITFQVKNPAIGYQFETDLKKVNAKLNDRTKNKQKVSFEIILSQSVEEFLMEFSKTESYQYIEGHSKLAFVDSIKNGSVIWNKANLNNILRNLHESKWDFELEKKNARLARMLDNKLITIHPVLLPEYDVTAIKPYLGQIFSTENYLPIKKELYAICWIKETYQDIPKFFKKGNHFYLESANLRIKVGKADPLEIITALENNEMYGVIPYQSTTYSILYLLKPTAALKTVMNEKKYMRTLFLGSYEESRLRQFQDIRDKAVKIYREVQKFEKGDILEWKTETGKIQKGMFDYESATLENAFEEYKREKELSDVLFDDEGRRFVTSWNGCLTTNGDSPYVVMHTTKITKEELRYDFFAIPKEKLKCVLRLNPDEIRSAILQYHDQKGCNAKRYNTRYLGDASNAIYIQEEDVILYYANAIIHTASKNYIEENITLEETISLIGAVMNGKSSSKAKELFEEILELSQKKNRIVNELPPVSVVYTEKELHTVERLLAITKELYKKYVYFEYVSWEEGRNYINEDLYYKYDMQGYQAYVKAFHKQEDELNQLNIARNTIKAQLARK